MSRATLGWAALALAVLELLTAFFIEAPVVAVVFAALFVVGWLLLRRGGIPGVVFLLVLFAIELLGLPFYPRDDAADWIFQTLALVLSVVGLAAGVAALRGRPRVAA